MYWIAIAGSTLLLSLKERTVRGRGRGRGVGVGSRGGRVKVEVWGLGFGV